MQREPGFYWVWSDAWEVAQYCEELGWQYTGSEANKYWGDAYSEPDLIGPRILPPNQP
jgi:hypothetical protein